MKNLVVALWAVCIMAGCDSTNVEPKEAPQTVVAMQEEETPSSRSGFTGFEMHMFEDSATLGETRTVSFRINAGSGEILGDANEYSLKDIRAVVYSESGDEVTFEAKMADFSESEQKASLQDDVRIHAGVFAMTMQRVDWDNEEGIARSDSPVTIDQGATHLAAAGMTIDPKTQSILFHGVRGRIEFEKEKL